jgi:hypothetical protein
MMRETSFEYTGSSCTDAPVPQWCTVSRETAQVVQGPSLHSLRPLIHDPRNKRRHHSDKPHCLGAPSSSYSNPSIVSGVIQGVEVKLNTLVGTYRHRPRRIPVAWTFRISVAPHHDGARGVQRRTWEVVTKPPPSTHLNILRQSRHNPRSPPELAIQPHLFPASQSLSPSPCRLSRALPRSSTTAAACASASSTRAGTRPSSSPSSGEPRTSCSPAVSRRATSSSSPFPARGSCPLACRGTSLPLHHASL